MVKSELIKDNTETVNVTDLTEGIYMLVVSYGNTTRAMKIVIDR